MRASDSILLDPTPRKPIGRVDVYTDGAPRRPFRVRGYLVAREIRSLPPPQPTGRVLEPLEQEARRMGCDAIEVTAETFVIPGRHRYTSFGQRARCLVYTWEPQQ